MNHLNVESQYDNKHRCRKTNSVVIVPEYRYYSTNIDGQQIQQLKHLKYLKFISQYDNNHRCRKDNSIRIAAEYRYYITNIDGQQIEQLKHLKYLKTIRSKRQTGYERKDKQEKKFHKHVSKKIREVGKSSSTLAIRNLWESWILSDKLKSRMNIQQKYNRKIENILPEIENRVTENRHNSDGRNHIRVTIRLTG